jgi:hypothetical protein
MASIKFRLNMGYIQQVLRLSIHDVVNSEHAKRMMLFEYKNTIRLQAEREYQAWWRFMDWSAHVRFGVLPEWGGGPAGWTPTEMDLNPPPPTGRIPFLGMLRLYVPSKNYSQFGYEQRAVS